MPDPALAQIAATAFVALMAESLRCPCDQGAVPLCVRCECLFRLAVAASEYALNLARQPRGRARLTEANLAWAHQAAARQGWRGGDG